MKIKEFIRNVETKLFIAQLIVEVTINNVTPKAIQILCFMVESNCIEDALTKCEDIGATLSDSYRNKNGEVVLSEYSGVESCEPLSTSEWIDGIEVGNFIFSELTTVNDLLTRERSDLPILNNR